MLAKLSPIAKALVGAAVAFTSAVALGLDDNTVSAREWAEAVTAGLIALGAVWAVPNSDAGR